MDPEGPHKDPHTVHEGPQGTHKGPHVVHEDPEWIRGDALGVLWDPPETRNRSGPPNPRKYKQYSRLR